MTNSKFKISNCRLRYVFTILLLTLCASTYTARAVNINAVHFRAASIDIVSQKYLLQWYYPNSNDTAAIKEVLLLQLRTDELQTPVLETIDTVNRQVNRYIVDTFRCCTPQSFALRLVDTSPSSPPPATDLFRTMQLNALSLDTCANAINLRWSPYQKLDRLDYPNYRPIADFTDEVRYHIYGYVGNSTFNPDSMEWLATSESATSFALPIVQEKKYHHLLVAAVYNNGADTSYSNRERIFTPMLVRPQYISIDSVLIGEEGTTLRFHIDPNTEYRRFWAEKSNDAAMGFEPFAEFNSKQQTTVNNDIGGNSIVFYRISSVNACAQVTVSSPVATSLAVNVYSDGNANTISWNKITYNGYDATYNVYRTSPPELATMIGSNLADNSATDDLSLLPDSIIGARICYAVESIVQDESLQSINYVNSASTCHAVTPEVYMPNAIQLSSGVVNTATGKSRNLFEPVSSYALTYTLHIYARAGKQIYSGSEAWNGRENNTGDFVNEGSYIYFVKIIFANGNQVEKTGNVTVVY